MCLVMENMCEFSKNLCEDFEIKITQQTYFQPCGPILNGCTVEDSYGKIRLNVCSHGLIYA